jgi:hypothetical protein
MGLLGTGGRLVAKLLVVALWATVTVALFTAGEVLPALGCSAYLVYLTLFRGRLLIY